MIRSITLLIGIACTFLSVPAAGAIPLAGSNCPHIEVLQKQDAGQVREEYRDKIDNPGSAQIRYLAKAVNLLPPLLCQAVRRVVFVDFSAEPAVIGWTLANESQDLIYLNSTKRALWDNFKIDSSPTEQAKAIQNFVHESTHAAVRLLQSRQKSEPPPGEFSGVQIKLVQKRPEPALWGMQAADQAQAAIEAMNLEDGVIREWIRLHESFRARGLAGRYYGEEWNDESKADLDHPTKGFTSAYGGQAPVEDIAELTGWAATAHLFTGGAGLAYGGQACDALGSHAGTGIPDELAAVFAKLDFLRNMGFIDKQSFEHCTGRPGRN